MEPGEIEYEGLFDPKGNVVYYANYPDQEQLLQRESNLDEKSLEPGLSQDKNMEATVESVLKTQTNGEHLKTQKIDENKTMGGKSKIKVNNKT